MSGNSEALYKPLILPHTSSDSISRGLSFLPVLGKNYLTVLCPGCWELLLCLWLAVWDGEAWREQWAKYYQPEHVNYGRPGHRGWILKAMGMVSIYTLWRKLWKYHNTSFVTTPGSEAWTFLWDLGILPWCCHLWTLGQCCLLVQKVSPLAEDIICDNVTPGTEATHNPTINSSHAKGSSAFPSPLSQNRTCWQTTE